MQQLQHPGQKAATPDNLVLLTHAEADAHDAEGSLERLRMEEPEFVAHVEAHLDIVRRTLFY
jgi:tRNA threonylcarbamoyladenosine dehydratase